jgi:amidophosphoribosyltransferase
LNSIPDNPQSESAWIVEDRPREECGVIGVFAPREDVASMAFFGLYALQHRGQEAAGIAVTDGNAIRLHKEVGLVSQVFNQANLLPLKGSYAIGHTRYSTTGSPSARNAQPFLIETIHGPLAVAHNGNLVNAAELRQDLLRKGIGLSSSSDSEVLTMMLAGADGDTWEERLRNTMGRWQGAYSLVVLTLEGVYAVRDPWGFRPLSVGMLAGGGHAVASESGALQTLGCLAIREVKPGEVIALSNAALRVLQALPPATPGLLRISSISISPGQIVSGTTGWCITCARTWGKSWPARCPPTPTWSSRCPIHPSRQPLVMPQSPACPTMTALSRTAISGGRSSSRPTRCANKAWP